MADWPGKVLTHDAGPADDQRGAYGSGGVEDNGSAGIADFRQQWPGDAASVGEIGPDGRLIVNVDGPGAPPIPEPGFGDQIAEGLGAGVRDIGAGAGQLANLVTSPIRAGMSALGLPEVDYEHIADNIADHLGLGRSTPVQQAIQRGIVSGLLTSGVGGLVAKAPGAVGAVGEALSAAPLTEAAASGASAGAGEAVRQNGGGPGAQLAASLLAGGVVGVAGARLGSARVSAPATDAQNVAAAAGRQDIDLLPADVGGPTTRRITAAAAQAPISASPIIKASQRVLEQGQAARDRVAASAGAATDAATAGEAARTGAEAYIKRTSRIGGGLYDRAANRAGDATIDPVEARQVLEDQIARLEAVPGGGQGLDEARTMRAALSGRFSVQGIRDMRTEMFVAPELRFGPAEVRMRQVVDAAARDVENGLRAQGKEAAANAFKTADDFWRTRLKTIDEVIQPVLGKPNVSKGGEAITKAIDTAAKGDVVKLQRFLATLPNEEASVVRASLINRLGMATKGNQNAEGDAFSLPAFLTHWNELSSRARNVLFDPEQRAALQDLATVAGGVKDASRYANFSNTSGGIWGNLGVIAGVSAGSPTTAAAGLAAQLIGGRLLASPRFARWLARSGRTQLSREAYIDRLTRIAAAEPAISGDILQLRDRLLSAANDGGVAQVAAQERDDQSRGVDR